MEYNQQVGDIVKEVWTTMLGLEATEVSNYDKDSGGDLCSFVSITGTWDGALYIDCSKQVATIAAESMFALDPGTAGADEIRDTLGELANMVGGNFKSIVGGNCQLSIPSVVEGTNFNVNMPGTEKLAEMQFQCNGEPFKVTLLHRVSK